MRVFWIYKPTIFLESVIIKPAIVTTPCPLSEIFYFI
nr:MAG TPA: hypothetical protein [Caudoviricetes sp.]